jgi:hypothetical protein
MAWIWMLAAAGAVLLWAVSLGRILSSPASSSSSGLPPLHGDRRSRNVLLVVAHPDDESMYVTSMLPASSCRVVCEVSAEGAVPVLQ